MGRSTEDDFLDFYAPQQNQIAYQFKLPISSEFTCEFSFLGYIIIIVT